VAQHDRQGEGQPAGEVYDWFIRGLSLLDGGNAEAAASLLAHARASEPGSASILEALARATFDAGRYAEAHDLFRELVEATPDNDYARFGLGLSRMRVGDVTGAVEQLALATAMRPAREDYQRALREARATLRARDRGGWPRGSAEPGPGGSGPVGPGGSGPVGPGRSSD
jgi:predicted Zn-dependent protease